MRGHGLHLWLCGALIVGAVIAVLVTSNALAFVPVIACGLMMGVMMLMMGGMGGRRE
jgi:hypothetical protein